MQPMPRQCVMATPTPVEVREDVPMYTGEIYRVEPRMPLSPRRGGMGNVAEPASVGEAPRAACGGGRVGGAGGPVRGAYKSKRMARRLSHWQCVHCRHETRNDARATHCVKCGGVKAQLRDADSKGREMARRAAREKEFQGRQLNARCVGTELVPRAAQGVFESTRREAMVRWEANELEQYTGAPSYVRREEIVLGVIESFFIVSTGARVSVMDDAKRARMTASDVASFFNAIGRRAAAGVAGEETFPMGGYFNEFRRDGVSAALMLELRDIVTTAIETSGGDVAAITRARRALTSVQFLAKPPSISEAGDRFPTRTGPTRTCDGPHQNQWFSAVTVSACFVKVRFRHHRY